MRASGFAAIAAAAAAFGLVACTSSVGGWKGGQSGGTAQPAGNYPLAQQTIDRMTSVDPSLKNFLQNAYGYAVFPTVSKGGFVVGGAYGEGGAFHANQMVAKCSLAQGTIGAQLGGQAYSEVIFFQDQPHFDNFVDGHFTFDAQASAVAVTAGAAANAAYSHGVAVFSLPKGGLMYEASVGGQKFTCHKVAAK